MTEATFSLSIDSEHDNSVITSWKEAEEFAASHMRKLGFLDSDVTRAGNDGGIDVQSTSAVAQVKHYAATPIGSPAVQQLVGAARDYRHGLFYALTGYTKAAIELAELSNVALFSYGLDGTVTPWSSAATRLADIGHIPAKTSFRAPETEKFFEQIKDWVHFIVGLGRVGRDDFHQAGLAILADNSKMPTDDDFGFGRRMNAVNKILDDVLTDPEWPISKWIETMIELEGHVVLGAQVLGLDFDEMQMRAREMYRTKQTRKKT